MSRDSTEIAVEECAACLASSKESATIRAKESAALPTAHESAALPTALDATMQEVVRLAAATLPEEMSAWQRSWCSYENLKMYLEARNGNVEDAAEILSLGLIWREKHSEVLSGSRTPNWNGDIRVLTRSRDGHALIYCCYVNQADRPHWEDTIEHVAAVMEAAVKALRGEAKQVDFVCDCHGFQFRKNADPRVGKNSVEMSKHAFRNRLRYCFIVDAGRAMETGWRWISPRLPPATREKVHFSSSAGVVQFLAEMVDPDVSRRVEDVMARNRSKNPALPKSLPSELAD